MALVNRWLALANWPLAGAVTGLVGPVHAVPFGARGLAFQVDLTVAGGGTTAVIYLQTSVDGGSKWSDIACVSLTTATARRIGAVKFDIAVAASVTPTDGAMTANTILDGYIGDRIRVKHTSTGTYTGASTIVVAGCFRG